MIQTMEPTGDFKIRLEEVFSGPMDLLLHLVREQEVEIHEIEIHVIIDGFLVYLQQLEGLDLDFAGDFVVMAASLMAIKSRSLLPHEEVDLEEELDPRDELIQRLIEYRRFREASEELSRRFATRGLQHGRGWRGEVREHEEEPLLELGELTAWDLLSNYARLLRETNANRTRTIARDQRPLRFYVENIVQRLRSMPASSLSKLLDQIEGGPRRETLIGSFCAILELVKLGLIKVEQPEPGQDIDISIRPEHSGDIDEVIRTAGFLDEEEAELVAEGGEDDTSEGTGEQVAGGSAGEVL